MVTNVKDYVDENHAKLVVIQGVVAVLFGVIVLFFPGLAFVNLVALFAVYFAVIGVIELVHGFRGIDHSGSRWFSLIVGFVLVVAAVHLVRSPAEDMGAFVALAGSLLVFRGLADLFVSAFYTVTSEYRTLWIVSGVIGVIGGLLLWQNSDMLGLTNVGVLGLYGLLVGAIELALAGRVRGK